MLEPGGGEEAEQPIETTLNSLILCAVKDGRRFCAGRFRLRDRCHMKRLALSALLSAATTAGPIVVCVTLV